MYLCISFTSYKVIMLICNYLLFQVTYTFVGNIIDQEILYIYYFTPTAS